MMVTIPVIAVLAAVLALFGYRAYRNTHCLQITRIQVPQRESGVDVSAQTREEKTLNILHLSDLHLENLSVTPERLYEELKEEAIDLIALTGDFLDRRRSIPKLGGYLEVLNRLQPTYGVYAVFGNHDYVLKRKSFERFRAVLEEYGCKTMQNEHDTIMIDGCPLHIIGIDDHSTKRSDIEASYSGIGDCDGKKLILTHDPNVVLELAGYEYDYLLSGHFHGGQIHWPKPYHLVKMGKLVRMNMVKGLHYFHGKPFYISEGLGQTGVNIRVGSRPEITLHQMTISRAEAAG